MKKLIPILTLALMAAAAPIATAMNYNANECDMILVFSTCLGGSKDVEFDLGTVSNYLGQASGTMLPVSYDTNLVNSNFGGSLDSVYWGMFASTSEGAPAFAFWTTDADLSNPADPTPSGISSYVTTTVTVGNRASSSTGHTPGTPWVDRPNDQDAYSYIVSGNNISSLDPTPVLEWNGSVPFPVMQLGTSSSCDFYQMVGSFSSPPATLVGSLAMDANGVITFTAAAPAAGPPPPPPPPQITHTANSSGVTTISFTTTNGASYVLLYSDAVNAPRSTWQTNTGAGTIIGDGTVKSFTDITPDRYRFYMIQGND